MTEPALFILGGALVLTTLYDFLRTTISLSGLGPLSAVLANTIWALAKRAVPFAEREFGLRVRGAIGPTILIVLSFIWVLLHLAGYTLMFQAGPSLLAGETQDPATLTQTAAFVGSALSTLGASSVSVTNGWWDMLSMMVAINGMIVLTLSVSYVLSVLQTTTRARVFAARFNAITLQTDEPAKTAVPEVAAALGSDLCDIAVKLASSPLPAYFSPQDEVVDFAQALRKLCSLIEAEGLPQGSPRNTDVSQLRSGLRLLGRSWDYAPSSNELDAAIMWANYYTLSAVPARKQCP